MKNIIFVAALLVCVYATGCSQATIPAAVTAAFNQKFQHAAKVKWDKENAHEYEASFQLNQKSYSANFSDKGEWLETENPIEFQQLPVKVQQAFNASHKGTVVKAVAVIETSIVFTPFLNSISYCVNPFDVSITATAFTTAPLCETLNACCTLPGSC